MKVFQRQLLVAWIVICNVFFSIAFASENTEKSAQEISSETSESVFSGLFRIGYISVNPNNAESAQGSAIGGKLSYSSASWNGISATGSLYTTQKLFNDPNGGFFSSESESFSILGQAYAQVNLASTEIKIGRFEFDSPHAGTDDVRMIPNTFSGILVANTDLTDTTVYLAHLDQWAGAGAYQPEEFTDLNNSDGVNVVGVVYQGFDDVSLQSWYYNASNLANLFYLEAMVDKGNFSYGAQYAKQSNKSAEVSATGGELFGIKASYTLNDFKLSSAYNYVAGTIVTGFSGGPFFTSAADHTIADVVDQRALALGIDYVGIDNVTIGLLNVDFDKGADELDLFISYDFGNAMTFDFIYHNIHEDGDLVLAMFNLGF